MYYFALIIENRLPKSVTMEFFNEGRTREILIPGKFLRNYVLRVFGNPQRVTTIFKAFESSTKTQVLLNGRKVLWITPTEGRQVIRVIITASKLIIFINLIIILLCACDLCQKKTNTKIF